MTLSTLIAATALAITAMTAGALLTAPIWIRHGRRAAERAEHLARPPRTMPPAPVRPTLRSQLDYALALAVAHARAEKPPRLNRWAYRDHLVARDPALERLTRRPGQHREQRQAVPA